MADKRDKFSDPYTDHFGGTLVAPPTLDQVSLEQGPVGGQLGPMIVSLLYDVGQQITHLQAGDSVRFYGPVTGSPFLQDQLPLNLNVGRRKLYAWRIVSMSRPPPRGVEQKPKAEEPKPQVSPEPTEYDLWLMQRRRKTRPPLPPESRPQLGSEKPSGEYAEYLQKRKGL
jgi:hypothetical protein